MFITLTTDFGHQDAFVGIMKGVIAGIDPAAKVIDLTHSIPPQDILAGALTLRHSVPYFPRGTIHVVVVDPGVGGKRRPILVESGGNYFIGPDNGVLSLAVSRESEHRFTLLSNPAYHLRPASATFHGRDIFAPTAAYLSRGVPPESFGERIDNIVQIEIPKVERQGRRLLGRIIYIDRFGNLFTNVERRDLTGVAEGQIEIRIGERAGRIVGLQPNYAAVPPGHLAALWNSWDLLEIASNLDSAQKITDASVGDQIEVVFLPGSAGGEKR
ncbi:MAG TPA: SAM-dependent chlorinase/fluorinase [Candidatus Binatia bacterium]|nr:SAM-dependent chlorinase/fluorinase [Candidatus Binatia bacterium]